MLRTFICSAFVLGLALTAALADDTKGKVKSVDSDKKTIVLVVGEGDNAKDVTFTVPEKAKVYTTGKKKKGKAGPETVIELSAIKADATVTVTTEKVDNKDVVTAVKLEPMGKKKKKTTN